MYSARPTNNNMLGAFIRNPTEESLVRTHGIEARVRERLNGGTLLPFENARPSSSSAANHNATTSLKLKEQQFAIHQSLNNRGRSFNTQPSRDQSNNDEDPHTIIHHLREAHMRCIEDELHLQIQNKISSEPLESAMYNSFSLWLSGELSVNVGGAPNVNGLSELVRSGPGSGGIEGIPHGGSDAEKSVLQKIASFAVIVEEKDSLQWLTDFTSIAQTIEFTFPTHSQMNSLWRVVSNILQPILGEGNAADEMSYVSSSRASLEKLALRRLLSAVGHATSDGDVGHLSMENVLSLIKCSYGSSGPWRAIFQCMLVGRYDAAAECAKEVGSNSLILALSDLANSTPLQRSKAPPKMDVLDLYRDSQTENDLFRKAVLFLLLSGHIDDTTKDPLRVMTTLCSEMGQCVEDNLWMRLCCVRGVEVQGRVKSIHSLSTLQKIVKNDAHSLLGSFKENEYLFCSFFFHAGLPCTAVLHLLSKKVTAVDGLHMLLCFHRAGQLKIGVPQENTINLEYHMRLYCSTLIKTGDHTTGSSIFSYYQKLNLTEFFILYCLTGDNFHALFGRRGFPYESGPLLMNRLYTDSVLRQVMCTVAERAASQLLYYVAIHVWLVLTNQAVMKEEEHNVRQYLHNALHVLVPAVAIALQSGPEAVRDIQCDVGAAKVAMDKVGNLVSPSDRGEWDCVLTMVTAYDLYNNLNHQQCYETVFRLPFIPTSEQEVSDCVMKYQSCSSSVITGMSCILNLFAESANHLLSYFNPYDSSAGQTSNEDQFNRIKTQVYIILQWYRKCCASGSTSGAFPPTLTKLSEIWYSTNPRF